MIHETIIDHKNQRAILEEQIATYRAEIVATIERDASVRLSFRDSFIRKNPGDLSDLPLVKLCSIHKNSMAEIGKHLTQMEDSMSSCYEKIRQSEQGIETTNQCMSICEKALLVVNGDAEDFELVSTAAEVENASISDL